MTVVVDDSDRRPIPRWRSFLSATSFGELLPLIARDPESMPKWTGEEQLVAWKHNQTFSVAADLVGAAYTSGRQDIGQDAAEFLLRGGDEFPLAKHIARRHLGYADPDVGTSPPSDLNSDISRSRSRLRINPYNPVLWSNLALLFTVAGQSEKAERAMLTALKLSPENRFILRSASRFFLHHGDIDRAHAILANATSVRSDPWVLASEIAVADVRGRPSRFIKLAQRVIDAKSHEPFHLSEACSALATIEAMSGNRRKAKKLSAAAMTDPAENSIAQAAWLYRNFEIATTDAPSSRQIQSSEANAWYARNEGHWERALGEAKKWLTEQPFSSRPAIFGCYVAASALEDHQEAVRIATQAINSNRNDPGLINNLAFSLASLGDVAEASNWIERGNRCATTPRHRICLTATAGLTAFRSGFPEVGRKLYRQAIRMAKLEKIDELAATAAVYCALEEVRLGTAFALPAKHEAMDATSKSISEPYRALFLAKLDQAVMQVID
jgi:tetratricopeptide (TPR) repeat protein